MRRLVLFLLMVMMMMVIPAVLGWAAVPRYPCYCPGCMMHGRPMPVFYCRNTRRLCNCDDCSCYQSSNVLHNSRHSDSDLMMMLMRGGFASTRYKKQHGWKDYD